MKKFLLIIIVVLLSSCQIPLELALKEDDIDVCETHNNNDEDIDECMFEWMEEKNSYTKENCNKLTLIENRNKCRYKLIDLIDEEIQKLEDDNKRLEDDNKKIQDDIDYYSSPEYMEKVAKEEFGLTLPPEVDSDSD